MPYFYILYSDLLDRFYLGSTRDQSESRLYKHNCKHKGFTCAAQDWKIVHQEHFEKYDDAHSREMEIKNWKSRQRIQKLIKEAQDGT